MKQCLMIFEVMFCLNLSQPWRFLLKSFIIILLSTYVKGEYSLDSHTLSLSYLSLSLSLSCLSLSPSLLIG